MRFTECVWIIFFALSVTAEVASEAPVCDANGKKCDETSPNDLMLMQKGVKKHLFAKAHSGDDDDKGIHDHMHIVCHAQGCAEVKATLSVLESKITTVKQKLEECGTSRAQLEKDLQVAAKDRATAEAGLAKCAAERAKLSADLKQCGKDRAAAEQALAKCGRERAILEAELRQCAEVDRPAAEKGLAKCGQERQALEIELAKLVEKLKSGAGGKVTKKKSSSRRRRRRNKSSLAQTDTESEDETDAEDEADADEDAAQRKEEVEARLVQLRAEASEFEKKLARLADTETTTMKAISASDGAIEDAENHLDTTTQAEQQAEHDYAEANKKTEEASASGTDSDGTMDAIVNTVQNQITEIGTAATQLASETDAKASALLQLMSLVQQQATLKHEELSLMHNKGVEKLQKIEAALQKHEDEECDDVRAEVITAKGKVQATAAALKTCLDTKKVISAKIAKIQKAREIAQKKLDACLATKAKLKTALHECHTRRDAAKVKLQECLDRKKALKPKIHECHVRRDEARKKLAACLAAKKSLKEKIKAVEAKMGSLSSAALVEIMNAHAQEHDSLLLDIEGITTELKESNEEFAETSLQMIEEGEKEKEIIDEIFATNQEETEIVDEITTTSSDQGKVEEATAELEGEIVDCTGALQQIDADSNAAAAACEEAQEAVQSAGVKLLEFHARISKQ